ncbi:ABC transporter permease [Methylacidiphilum sp. Yel]|jgi:lipoprotein-releasing system permease protein|uniref:ABC transporter permease n=1 Tax=Methylacidiphilum sp. Yel TaxID=1847730 RepID=UPI00106DCDAA|nr:ABC transporter permease [Methylacidiphilum sp. Yel]TFE67316.1 ABC transporter permease [Methylacidiphilum sp. Yel]
MHLPFSLFLALRYLRPRRSFVSVITLLSVLGVSLGVAVLVIVLSVMAGFSLELEKKIIGFNAHLVVSNGEILSRPQAIMELVEKDPLVVGAAPFVSGPVMVEYASRITTPILRGINIDLEEKVIPIKKFLIAGSYDLEGESVIVGEEWAKHSDAYLGDKVLIYAPRHFQAFRDNYQKGKQTTILPSEFTITGIFRTGLYEYDASYFITSLANAQYLYSLGNGVHGVSIRIQNPLAANKVKERLNLRLQPPEEALTWIDQNKPLFSAIAIERIAMTFILFFIIIVAAFGLCSTLITITVQKSKEIGLLKALGARDDQILSIFVLHGFIVGVFGTLLGLVLASFSLYYRNSFRDFIGKHLGIDLFSADVYHFSTIPMVIDPLLVTGISFGAIFICILAAWIPAMNAAKLTPAKALRYE